MSDSPGTVSKILWHFTGGPNWNPAESRQDTELKSEEQALEILVSIFNSKVLRLSNYRATIKNIEYRPGNRPMTRIGLQAKICCLADIPIQHLHYHAKRYGKFAMGFHRKSALMSSFNPVFYCLEDSEISRAVFQLSEMLGKPPKDLEKRNPMELRIVQGGMNEETRQAILGNLQTLQKVSAFMKTFTEAEINTIYCEREWRSLKEFNFNHSDVSMIVLPKKWIVKFREMAADLEDTIPIIPWEDLVES